MYIRSWKLHFVKVCSRTNTNIRYQYFQHVHTNINSKWGLEMILFSPGIISLSQVRRAALVSDLSVDLKNVLPRHLTVLAYLAQIL